MLRRRLSVLLVLACLAATSLGAASASADTGVIPDTPDLPWADPNHQSPLELVASGIASEIARRPVRVYCNGQGDWDSLARSAGFDPARVWGYVMAPRYWYPSLGTWAESSTHTQLAPIACERLWQFAKATTKPTKCTASRVITETRQVQVRYKVTTRSKVKKRARVKGKWVVRMVVTTRSVWRTRTEPRDVTRTIPLEPRSCYGSGEDGVTLEAPTDGWGRYGEFAFALQTLAHESVHLFSFTAGYPVPRSVQEEESRAECWGMQLIPYVAWSLGASEDDALAIGRWYAEDFYPRRQSSAPDYWSPDCKMDGGLDLTPGDGHWPLVLRPEVSPGGISLAAAALSPYVGLPFVAEAQAARP
jgi:hypothetical protein